MTFHSSLRFGFAASALVASLAGFASPALAIDAEDFATKLNAAYGVFNSHISYETVTANGNDVTLGSVKQGLPGQPEILLGDLTFEDVSDTGDGGYNVRRLGYNDFTLMQNETEITVSNMELNGIRIPGTPDEQSFDDMISYESARTGPITVKVKGDEVFSLASAEGNVKQRPDGAAVDIKLKANGVVIALGKIDAPKSRRMLSELGYDTLRGDVKMNMGWELETGRVHMREYAFTMNDVGRLNMTFDISGYTLELVKAMQQAQASAASHPDPLAAQQSMGLAMMGMLQQLTFNSGSIRFDDASATKKVLAYAGRKQGVSGDQMAQAIKGMMPLVLWQLGIPALQKQIAAATSAYLDNPQNITISANPASPVPVPMIMGAGMGDPWQLVDLLNVQVTANEPVLLCCKE